MKEEQNEAREVGHAHDVHAEEIQKLRDFASNYGMSVLVAVCCAVVIVAGVKFYGQHKRNSRREASMLLVQARSVNDLQDLLSTHPSAPAAPLALLKLAKVEYDMGNYPAARARYEQFVDKYPEHELIAAATVGQFFCAEAAGDRQAALEGYRDFERKYPDHFLRPQAVLGEGRCLLLLGMKDEARAVYEDFIAANPDSPWAGNAEEALDLLEKNAYTRAAEPAAPVFDMTGPETAPPIMAPVEVVPATPEVE